jgi:hypothetical protein
MEVGGFEFNFKIDKNKNVFAYHHGVLMAIKMKHFKFEGSKGIGRRCLKCGRAFPNTKQLERLYYLWKRRPRDENKANAQEHEEV